MKKQLLNIFSFSFVMLGSAALAQPTLTATGCNPVLGDGQTFTSTAYFAPGSAGAGQTWNFGSLTGTTGTPATVVTVASTPYAATFSGTSNIAINQGGGNYSFQKTSSTAYQNYGTVAGGTVINYSNPEDYVHYPFTYNNSFVDYWAATFTSGGYNFFRRGHTTVTADAYGTLTTPMGTFSNVTRVHFVQDYQDSTNIGVPYVITYLNDEYFWYVNGTHAQLAATYTFTSSASGTPTTGGFYLSAVTASVNENSEFVSSLNLFPNPATNNITIDLNLTENKSVTTTLYNAVGQQVQTAVTTEGTTGSNIVAFDISELPQGIYFAQILVDGKIAGTKRFVVSK